MFTKECVEKYNVSRTIVYDPDHITDIVHIITHAFNLTTDTCYFIIDSMGERQELRRCHPNFILC